MAIKITDLRIDPTSLGNTFLLADITPVYEYKDGQRTQNLQGFRYFCVLPSLKMEKLGIKVEHTTPLVDFEKEDIPVGTQVNFDNLEVGSYFSNGQININAKASNISFVGGKPNVQKQEIK